MQVNKPWIKRHLFIYLAVTLICAGLMVPLEQFIVFAIGFSTSVLIERKLQYGTIQMILIQLLQFIMLMIIVINSIRASAIIH